MKKLSALFLSLLLVMTLLAACGQGETQGDTTQGNNTTQTDNETVQTDGETYTIQLAGSVAEDHPITLGLYKFEELAEEYSDGRIQVDVYPNGQLGSNREHYEQCQQGNIQMAEGGAVAPHSDGALAVGIALSPADNGGFLQIVPIFDRSAAAGA